MFLKPKDIAERLHLPAYKVSVLAKDLEKSGYCIFQKTPLGSFLFIEKDYIVLKQYSEMLYFFKRKRHALEMLKQQLPSQEEEETENVLAHMKHARFV